MRDFLFPFQPSVDKNFTCNFHYLLLTGSLAVGPITDIKSKNLDLDSVQQVRASAGASLGVPILSIPKGG